MEPGAFPINKSSFVLESPLWRVQEGVGWRMEFYIPCQCLLFVMKMFVFNIYEIVGPNSNKLLIF